MDITNQTQRTRANCSAEHQEETSVTDTAIQAAVAAAETASLLEQQDASLQVKQVVVLSQQAEQSQEAFEPPALHRQKTFEPPELHRQKTFEPPEPSSAERSNAYTSNFEDDTECARSPIFLEEDSD